MFDDRLIATGAVALAAGSASAQLCGGWTAEATSGPPPLEKPVMVNDTARQRVVFFGGVGPGSPDPDDTWEWDGSAWTLVATTGPVSRNYSAGAFDPIRQRVVMFGGTLVGPVALNDTQEWDGATWTAFAGAAPPARFGHSLAFDPTMGKIVMFGGQSSFLARDERYDTWAYDGTTWTQIATDGPRLALFNKMFFDPHRNALMLIGPARDGSGTQVWQWDGVSAWTRITVEEGLPAPNVSSSTDGAWDEARGVYVFYTDGPFVESVTWEWDGVSFVNVGHGINESVVRVYAGAAYDSNLDRVLLHGGRSAFGPLGSTTWGLRSTPARIDDQPDSGVVYAGSPLSARVHPGGSSPFTYQWRWDGVPLTDGGRISGATTRTLRIASAEVGDSGDFDVVVTNACGEVTSVTVTIGVLDCPPDINQDGILDFFDYADFVDGFEAAGPRADYNQDGFIDFFDYADFVEDFEAGC